MNKKKKNPSQAQLEKHNSSSPQLNPIAVIVLLYLLVIRTFTVDETRKTRSYREVQNQQNQFQ